ncbi:MAG: alpha/beta hydrolase [Rhodospirillales bacterium 69-11]|nr:alpha/beta hydrolase [Rhodospirillales bacterium]OJW29604.1 MAG: alpha/beta hydrolase [Rhodospirillales bacterium 69-11]
MPMIRTDDDVQLHVEEAGQGDPILFIHEFGGHHLSWEPQIRHFSRRYRCITYAARGWPPSDVPGEVGAYSQARAADDAAAVLRGLGLARAHLVGLSMGATAAVEFGIRHPGMALSLTVAGAGSGASTDPAAKRKFRDDCIAFADRIERDGMAAMAELYCAGAARLQYRAKDPRGWAEFKRQFAAGSALGHAMTMRGVQADRVPLFERKAELAAIPAPVLVIAGDEDDSTLDLALFLKRTIARCGLLVLPRTGHTINLEEPAAFNAALENFLLAVEHEAWPAQAHLGGGGYLLVPSSRK